MSSTSCRRLVSPVALLGLLAGLSLLLACGGGGGGGGSADVGAGGGTGSVGVLVTDAPVDPDLFSEINITFDQVDLISDAGHVPIFSGRQTINLRDFEDVGKLVTLGRNVPARRFDKIRLLLHDIELVPADGSAPIHPKLPPKLDINPQETIHLKPGALLLVQIDFDMANSIINEKGNGTWGFRPVVIADILSVRLPGKLILLEGVVDQLDVDAGTFRLCRTGHFVSEPSSEGRVTRSDDDRDREDGSHEEGERDDFCVKVVTDDDTSVFDANGDPADLAVLMDGDEASVLGRFMRDGERDDHEALVFDAEVVQQGGSALAVDGEVLSEVDADGRFEIEVDPGQGFVEGTVLVVQLQEGAKIFSRKGRTLDEADIVPGAPVRATGVLELSSTDDDVLKAAFVVLDVEAMHAERISGEITSVESEGARLDVLTDEGSRCVDVPDDARVYAVTVVGDDASAEAIDRSELQVGDAVNVFGEPGPLPDECLQATTVIAFHVDGSS